MKFRFSNRVIIYIAILIVAALWILASAAAPGSTTKGRIPAPQAGFLAPEISLPTASGEIIRLSDLRGHPVLVNFWASWCPPCRAEMPAIQQVYQSLQSHGVVVLSVNAANQDDRAQAAEFIRSLGLKFPIVFDEAGQASAAYALHSLPSSFFIDSEGVIRDVVVGGMSEAALSIRLHRLLGETGGAASP